MTQRIFGIVGWKNSGKTTLTVKLIAELTRRGYRVSSVKHAHHSFDIDHEGTDSHRHRMAGAGETAIVSAHRWALMHEGDGENEPPLSAILARLAPCDIVLIEGYKRDDHTKIEARRLDAKDQKPMTGWIDNIVAVAADHDAKTAGLPLFALDDIAAVADFVEAETGLAAPAP